MTDRSGCGLAVLTVLEVVDELSADGRDVVASAEVLDEVDQRIGLGPGYAYPMLCDRVMPWVVPVALLAMDGSPYDRMFREPEPAAHTLCRLSRAGKVVLAAEAGAIAPVPAGLINGTWWRGAVLAGLGRCHEVCRWRRANAPPARPHPAQARPHHRITRPDWTHPRTTTARPWPFKFF